MLAAWTLGVALGAQSPLEDSPLLRPLDVAEPFRLAKTPELDGNLAPEEWEPFAISNERATFLQWQPRALHWAAEVADGQDVVLSLDENGDGWSVGADNLEVRVGLRDGELRMRVRRLDATFPMGPTWVEPDVLLESLDFGTSQFDGGWTLEGSYLPLVGSEFEPGGAFGVRIDVVDAEDDLGPAFVPRVMSFVRLALDLGRNVPLGLGWTPGFEVRTVAAGDRFGVGHDLYRTEESVVDVRSVSFRTEGLGGSLTAEGTTPLEAFDDRDRTRAEYETLVAPDAPVGWQVLRATVLTDSGEEVVLRSSYRIASLLDLEVSLPTDLVQQDTPQVIRGDVTLRSQSRQRIDGRLRVELPAAWGSPRGDGARILIYHSRGSQRIGFDLLTPPDASGVFPITFVAEVGDRVVRQTVLLPIAESPDA